MLNTLAATIFDPAGYVELSVASDIDVAQPARRVNRISTLDGGVTYNDGGYSSGDLTIELVWPVGAQSVEQSVQRLIELYSIVTVSTRMGVFSALLQSYSPGQEESTLRLLVLSKLSS